jgi:rRNA maturation endonuclease Nob1
MELTMKTYIEQIRSSLEEIETWLCDFIATVTMGEFHNDPNSGIFVMTHPYFYRTDIDDEQKKVQIEINKLYTAWLEHFLLLTANMPEDIEKEISDSQAFLQDQINLKSDWGTEETIEENITRIRKRFKALYSIIALFEKEGETVLIPDTNALIKEPDFARYKSLAGDIVTIILIPTVLSELDKLKVTALKDEFRNKVNSVIKRIKGLRQQGSLNSGVTVKMIAQEPDFSHTLSWLDKENNDDRIIATVLEYQRSNPSHRVFLVTGDINLQNKAEQARIPFFEAP